MLDSQRRNISRRATPSRSEKISSIAFPEYYAATLEEAGDADLPLGPSRA
jgi:hypothetical protein